MEAGADGGASVVKGSGGLLKSSLSDDSELVGVDKFVLGDGGDGDGYPAGHVGGNGSADDLGYVPSYTKRHLVSSPAIRIRFQWAR